MLYIYTHTVTNRINYVFGLIFKEILALDVTLTSDLTEFSNYKGPKISYGDKPIGDELFFGATRLLFEKGIIDQDIKMSKYRDLPCFFLIKNAQTEFPFDVFAVCFYLVTRYEEYLPHIPDLHNRFPANSSIAFANGFLQIPLVNIYARWIKESISKKHPTLIFPKGEYKFVSTIDVDNAFKFKQKGFARNMGGYLRALYKFDFEEIVERTQVLFFGKKDPFDTYEEHLALKAKYKFDNIYFFLLGDYAHNDKNISIRKRRNSYY